MSDLDVDVVRLAATTWITPERVRTVVAALLDRAEPVTVGAVLNEFRADRRPLASPPEVDAALTALRRAEARVLVVGRPGYPSRLAQAWPELGAPVWLFARGAPQPQAAPQAAPQAGSQAAPRAAPEATPVPQAPRTTPWPGLPDGPTVAVVGTRRPSHDGLRTSRALGRLLGEAGVTVVSGLARGIDQAAHQGALQAGGPTIAVLGAGFGVDYPRGAGRLRAEIAAAGGLVTEYLPGVPPVPRHFLWRNRVISGLADATVVVEGRERSGALATARLAAAQGREVLAAPGSVNAPTSAAPLALLRDGARPLTRLDEVLEVVGADRPDPGSGPGGGWEPDDDAGAVLALLGPVPVGVDELAATTGLPVSSVLVAISELAGRGLAEATASGVVAGPRAQPP